MIHMDRVPVVAKKKQSKGERKKKNAKEIVAINTKGRNNMSSVVLIPIRERKERERKTRNGEEIVWFHRDVENQKLQEEQFSPTAFEYRILTFS